MAGQDESNRDTTALAVGKRHSQRARMRLNAKLMTPAREMQVVLCNLSCTGAMVEGLDLPPVGRTVALHRQEIDELAAVVWTRQCFAGLAFFDPIALEVVLDQASQPAEDIANAPPTICAVSTLPDDHLSVEEWKKVKALGLRSAKGNSSGIDE